MTENTKKTINERQALAQAITQIPLSISENSQHWGLRSSGPGMRLDALSQDWESHLLEPFGNPCLYFEVYTEERLALLQDIRSVLVALEGLPVTVRYRTSWRWGRGAPGQSPYFIVYVLTVSPADSPWEVESKLAKEILELPHVPRVELGDIDLHVARHLLNNGMPDLPYCESEWTKTGLKLGLHKPEPEVLARCFPTAKITIGRRESKAAIQTVVIDFAEPLVGLPVEFK